MSTLFILLVLLSVSSALLGYYVGKDSRDA